MTSLKNLPWMWIAAVVALVGTVIAAASWARRRGAADPAEEMARTGRRGSPAPVSEVVTV